MGLNLGSPATAGLTILDNDREPIAVYYSVAEDDSNMLPGPVAMDTSGGVAITAAGSCYRQDDLAALNPGRGKRPWVDLFANPWWNFCRLLKNSKRCGLRLLSRGLTSTKQSKPSVIAIGMKLGDYKGKATFQD